MGEPELAELSNGHKEWRLNGNRHREDGPAVIYPNGSKEWWLGGKRHRTDGPAYDGKNGIREWWLNGVRMDPLEHFIKAQEIQHG